jgi:putative phage-type endonuclease
MEYSVEHTTPICEHDYDSSKTIFLSRPHYTGVQYHESDFEDGSVDLGSLDPNIVDADALADVVDADADSDVDDTGSQTSDESLSFMDSLTEEEQSIFHEECLRLFEDFFDDATNVAKMSSPMIEQTVATEISSTIFELCATFMHENVMQDSDYEEIYEFVMKHVVEYAFEAELWVKPRQQGPGQGQGQGQGQDLNKQDLNKNPNKNLNPLKRAIIDRKLAHLASCPNPPQRSQEWYDSRYAALTASNLWKALGSDAQRNSLIFEKCKPYDQFIAECNKHSNLSTENAMHWGIKYEPITAQIYEHKERVVLNTAYGCIRHPDHAFLGASPDAIVADPASPKYGRMVEIKNIVNREITGVPLEHYWIQMQAQMEVCDLDECDFVETQIREYTDAAECFADTTREYRGIIIRFTERLSIDDIIERQQSNIAIEKPPFYEYSPVFGPDSRSTNSSNLEEEANKWISDRKLYYAKDYVAFHISYWYLDKYSCVMVQRNEAWFAAILPKLEDCWRTVEKEKKEGYGPRAPKSKSQKYGTNTNGSSNHGSNTNVKNNLLIQVNKLDFSETGPEFEFESDDN